MDDTQLIIWTITWIVCWGCIGYEIGKKKGEALSGCFWGVLLGPIGVLIALVSKGNRINCPYCKSLIDPAASVCAYCHKNLVKGNETTPANSINTEELLKLKQLLDGGVITQEEFDAAKARTLGMQTEPTGRPPFVQMR